MNLITSRDNPLLKTLRRLAQESNAYRKLGQFWLEGDHLCRAALQRGARPVRVVLAQSLADSAPADEWLGLELPVTVIPDELFAGLSGLESPARMGFVMANEAVRKVAADAPTVILDRLQDAGNVGAILRCASAFGFRQVLALQGTAALWSHKVLRAGMGAHFGLHLHEGLQESDLEVLTVPLVATSSHGGPFLHELQREALLPVPCAWVMGHEGQGVRESLMARASLQVRIAQPGGEESLNVATAAAICLHASATSAL
ncbi:MAG: TrmH family RNA methyltransferase [Limnohabitans sp.]